MSDQQDRWGDDPVSRALRAPGTPEELAGEAEYVAMFRAVSTPVPAGVRTGRSLGRVGVAAATVMATVVLTGGVAAAAYTRTLPGPVQEIAHGVLGPIGVPAPPAQRREASPSKTRGVTPPTHRPTPAATPTPRPTKPATADPSPESRPAATATAPVPMATEPAPSATTPVTPSPTAPPEPDATTPPPPLPLPVVTATVSSNRVPWQETATVTGRVATEDGSPLRRRVVTLLGRAPGDTAWQVLARARADRYGTVRLSTTIETTTRLVLRSGRGVRSAPMRVVMLPSVSAWATTSTTGTRIRVATSGGQPGDTVTLLRRLNGQLVPVTTTTLDAQGRALLTLPTSGERLRVRLDRTRQHAAVATRVSPSV